MVVLELPWEDPERATGKETKALEIVNLTDLAEVTGRGQSESTERTSGPLHQIKA